MSVPLPKWAEEYATYQRDYSHLQRRPASENIGQLRIVKAVAYGIQGTGSRRNLIRERTA